MLVRCQLLMQTVDCIIQSKEEGDICLGCLRVDRQSGGGRSSFLRLPGSRSLFPLLPGSEDQVEEDHNDDEAQGEDVHKQVLSILEGSESTGSV